MLWSIKNLLLVGGFKHFSSFFIFHNIWDSGIILPIDFHIFQDGYCTTNQIMILFWFPIYYMILRHLMDPPTSNAFGEGLLKIGGLRPGSGAAVRPNSKLHNLHLVPTWSTCSMITLIEDLQEGIKSPPLFYVEESEIAYKGETREFGQRVFEDLYSTLKSQSLLQHRYD